MCFTKIKDKFLKNVFTVWKSQAGTSNCSSQRVISGPIFGLPMRRIGEKNKNSMNGTNYGNTNAPK